MKQSRKKNFTNMLATEKIVVKDKKAALRLIVISLQDYL